MSTLTLVPPPRVEKPAPEVVEAIQRMAMDVRLASLRVLALKAKYGETDLERQMALSVLVEMAATDWRVSLPEDCK